MVRQNINGGKNIKPNFKGRGGINKNPMPLMSLPPGLRRPMMPPGRGGMRHPMMNGPPRHPGRMGPLMPPNRMAMRGMNIGPRGPPGRMMSCHGPNRMGPPRLGAPPHMMGPQLRMDSMDGRKTSFDGMKKSFNKFPPGRGRPPLRGMPPPHFMGPPIPPPFGRGMVHPMRGRNFMRGGSRGRGAARAKDKNSPKPVKKQAEMNKPWVTEAMKNEIMKKHKLLQKAKRSKEPEDYDAFKEQRNKVTTMLREAKLEYIGAHPEEDVDKILAEVALAGNKNAESPDSSDDKDEAGTEPGSSPSREDDGQEADSNPLNLDGEKNPSLDEGTHQVANNGGVPGLSTSL